MTVDQRDFEAIVLEHIDAENARQRGRVLATLEAGATLRDVPNQTTIDGAEAVVEHISQRWHGFPNLKRQILRLQTGDSGTYVEMRVSGAQEGKFRGENNQGGSLDLQVCLFFEPSQVGKIKGITTYYDQVTILRQLKLPKSIYPR